MTIVAIIVFPICRTKNAQIIKNYTIKIILRNNMIAMERKGLFGFHFLVLSCLIKIFCLNISR